MTSRLPAALVLALPLLAQGACPGGAAWCEDAARVQLVRAGAPVLVSDPAATRLAAVEHHAEVRLRPAGSIDGPRRAVLAVRYADARNWLGAAVTITPGRPKMGVELVQMLDGELRRLRAIDRDAAPAGGYQTLRVELARGELLAWLDGERVSAPLPTPAPGGGTALLAEQGGFEFTGLRLGAAGGRPGRIALAQRGTRVQLHAGEVQRYPVSTDGGVPDLRASSSDPAVAGATIEHGELQLRAHRAGTAVITIASAQDANAAHAIGLQVGPAFAARTDARELTGRLLPAAGALEVQADTPLRIRFDRVPTLGAGGSVRIYRAGDRKLVDVVRLGDEVDAIGPRDAAVKRVVRVSPILVDGKDLLVHLHSARLDYGSDYLVEVDAGLVTGAAVHGQPFAGIGKGWGFRTRSAAPGATSLTVDDDGPADFRTVQGALNHAMQAVPREQAVTIRIANGRYHELLYLRGKDKVRLLGESRDGVVIGAINNDGLNPGAGSGQPLDAPAAGGGRAVFLAEDADLLTLDRLTLLNPTVRAASFGGQAEALHFASDRGRLVARDAAFHSEQDTLLVRGYSWFYRSLVAGNVDFIWGGNRAALFEESEIRSVGDSAHGKGGGYIVQARTVDPNDAGFVFLNSRLTHGPGPAGNDVPPGATWLARPGPTGAGDKVVYLHTRMDVHVAPGGWSLPKTIAPGTQPGAGWREYGSMDLSGQPLDLSRRSGARPLTPSEAARYASRARVFSTFDNGKGWDPAPND